MKHPIHASVLFRWSVSLLLVVSLAVPALKASAIELGGSFVTSGYNNPIALNDLSLKAYDENSQDYTQEVSTLTPTQSYRISFTVSDFDALNTVLWEVVLIHDQDGFVDVDEANGIDDTFEHAQGMTSEGDQFDLIWNSSLTQGPEVALLEGETTSWILLDSNVRDLPVDALSYTFTFDFKVSKAAAADDHWALNVRVMDDYRETAGNPTMAVLRMDQLSVQWYGEITTPVSAAYNWGTPKAGMDYSDSTAKQAVSMNFLANGPFEQVISADATWSGARQNDTAIGVTTQSTSAALASDASADQTFAIRVNGSDAPQKGYAADYVQLSALSQQLSVSALKTSELGLDQTYSLYLKLSERYQNGLYEGVIRFGISNSLQP